MELKTVYVASNLLNRIKLVWKECCLKIHKQLEHVYWEGDKQMSTETTETLFDKRKNTSKRSHCSNDTLWQIQVNRYKINN